MTLNSVGSSSIIVFSVLYGFHLGGQLIDLRFRTLGDMFKDYPGQTVYFLVKETEVQWLVEMVNFSLQYIPGMSSVYLNVLGVLRKDACVL